MPPRWNTTTRTLPRPFCSAPAARTRKVGGNPNATNPSPTDLRNDRRECSISSPLEFRRSKQKSNRCGTFGLVQRCASRGGNGVWCDQRNDRLRIANGVFLDARAGQTIGYQIADEIHPRQQHV